MGWNVTVPSQPPADPPPPGEVFDSATETASDIVDAAEDAAEDILTGASDAADAGADAAAAGAQTVGNAAADPMGTLRAVLTEVKSGVQQFGDNAATHISNGLGTWLVDTLKSTGITPPSQLSTRDLIVFALQVLGVTKDRVQQRAERMFPGLSGLPPLELSSTPSPQDLWQFVKQTLLVAVHVAAEKGAQSAGPKAEKTTESGTEQVYGTVLATVLLLSSSVHVLLTTLAPRRPVRGRGGPRAFRAAQHGELQRKISGTAVVVQQAGALRKDGGSDAQFFTALATAQRSVNAGTPLLRRRVRASEAAATAALHDLQRLRRAVSNVRARWRPPRGVQQAYVLTALRDVEGAVNAAHLQLTSAVDAARQIRSRKVAFPR